MIAMKRIGWLLAIGGTIAALLLITILVNAFAGIHSVVYTIPAAELSGGLRLALVSDLHSSRYGFRQEKLMRAIDAAAPDVVLLCGDIFDAAAPFRQASIFLEAVGQAYPCYYVFGNHEYNSKKVDTVREIMEAAGIPILEGDSLRFTANGQSIRIAGVTDVRHSYGDYTEQLARVAGTLKRTDEFSVLLSHQPQYIAEILGTGADLILSGHTHGGQWSIPSVVNGIYAPGQGLLPKYAGGLYAFDAQTLIISRGLSKLPLWIPRFFTPRELVLIDLIPKS